MDNELIYLDTYLVQKDMRIRLPKSILANMDIEKGKSTFDFYYNKKENSLILRPTPGQEVRNES